MPKTKIISFCPVTRELRDAVRAEGFDGPITNEVSLWLEVLAEVEAMTQADDPREAMDLGSAQCVDRATSLTASIFNHPMPHIFILPRAGGDVGLLRALVLTDLHDFDGEDAATATAYVWSPYTTKLVKVFPAPKSEG